MLGKVTAGPCADRVSVRLVSGQSPKLTSPTGPRNWRTGSARTPAGSAPPGPGMVVLELVRRDALADADARPARSRRRPDLRALPVGRCEDGAAFTIRLHGTHLLIAGATGAGKGSYLWGLVRALLPAMAAGLVRVLACDPKLMELAFGRALFDRYGKYAADPADIAGPARSRRRRHAGAGPARFAGRQRDHTPTGRVPVRGGPGR